MKLIFHIVLLTIYITATNSYLYNNIKDNVLSFLNGQEHGEESSLNDGMNDDLPRSRFDESVEQDNYQRGKSAYKKLNDEIWRKEDRQRVDHTKTPIIKKPWQRQTFRKPNPIRVKKPGHILEMPPNQRHREPDKHKQRYDNWRNIDSTQNNVEFLKRAELDAMNDVNTIASSKTKFGQQRYFRDPVMNLLRSRDLRRRQADSDPLSSSSSREMMNWKEEWKEHWMQKKFEALNASAPRGDVVNMVAARPWGVPCGDPNQHDMPWGSCVLAPECEGEYRIYRGDFLCGRTEFVCCALQLTNYDLYQGFDVSFDDKSLSTDSEEKRHRNKDSKGKKHNQKRRDRIKRQRERLKRKRKIRRKIRKIVREIRKIMNRFYKNGTKERKKKTKLLKKFIKDLKKQYRHDRESVKDLHEMQILKIDKTLMDRLQQIREMNHQFKYNDTFRDIVVNGSITKEQGRVLLESYPELSSYIHMRRSGVPTKNEEPKDYVEYDMEYGYLYY